AAVSPAGRIARRSRDAGMGTPPGQSWRSSYGSASATGRCARNSTATGSFAGSAGIRPQAVAALEPVLAPQDGQVPAGKPDIQASCPGALERSPQTASESDAEPLAGGISPPAH